MVVGFIGVDKTAKIALLPPVLLQMGQKAQLGVAQRQV
jgi:hypothetical protein